jgi:hypothetical protein
MQPGARKYCNTWESSIRKIKVLPTIRHILVVVWMKTRHATKINKLDT